MRAERITARGFRNLADLELVFPPAGAVFLGPNGHGKTNLLELLYYPVLFRSLRGARDVDVTRHGEAGFQVALTVERGGPARELEAGFRIAGKRKRITLDGTEPDRLGDAIGRWLAVAFLPSDLRLVQGAAAERRRYLDRMLSLADRTHLRALGRYRHALRQRNAALRQSRPEVAAVFDQPLAEAGAALVRGRQAWVMARGERFTAECIALGEETEVAMRYRGTNDGALADPLAWPAALHRARARDNALGSTTVGPHRDDLELRIGGRLLREVGSTGQQRTAAVALKLGERDTLAGAHSTEPALLLDDVFAELDPARQHRLVERLQDGSTPRQVFVTSPREDELPDAFHLEVLAVSAGRVSATVSGGLG